VRARPSSARSTRSSSKQHRAVQRKLHPGGGSHGGSPQIRGLEQVRSSPRLTIPRKAGLFAVYPGSDSKAKAILLLAHIDVVEAKREDWTRDPFVLVEENGFVLCARRSGTTRPRRPSGSIPSCVTRRRSSNRGGTIKIALTCGEETAGAFNGAQWLAQNHRDWIDAEFAINEGAWGELDAQGRKLVMNVQAGEKAAQNYRLEVTNPGGHSSRPGKDNAIYQLAGALSRIEAYEFPAQFTDASRAYFAAWRRSRPRRQRRRRRGDECDGQGSG
jgi:acetylornithine deacetylase/succinyl-diaminopimelate desuccinylase-like protein